MSKTVLIERNKTLAIGVIDLLSSIPKDMANDVLARQLMRCSTSIGANYRAACRAKSSADFINKLKIVEEETDETIYFLELLEYVDSGTNKKSIASLLSEANELLAIYVASIKTARNNRQAKNIEN